MNNVLKAALFGLVMLYIVSPADAMPGPMDDMLVALLGYVGTRLLESRKNNRNF